MTVHRVLTFRRETTIYARAVSAFQRAHRPLHFETEITMTNDSREREAR
jgi:hypothetical protein